MNRWYALPSLGVLGGLSYISYSAVFWDGQYGGIPIQLFAQSENVSQVLVSKVSAPKADPITIIEPKTNVVKEPSNSTTTLTEQQQKNLEQFGIYFVTNERVLRARISSIRTKLKTTLRMINLQDYPHTAHIQGKTLTVDSVLDVCTKASQEKYIHYFSSSDYLDLIWDFCGQVNKTKPTHFIS